MSELRIAMTSLLRQRAFIVVAIILLIAAVGLNGATQFMQLHFRKLPVAPARPLVDIPEKIGPWLQVSTDETLDPDLIHTLGTDDYVFRDFIDTRVLSPEDVEHFKDQDATTRKQMLARVQQAHPDAVVNMSLTYYTGLVDTVAHVPDRCFVADGYEPTSYQIEDCSALASAPPDQRSARYIVFEDETPGRQMVARNVAYFFNCDGKFMQDPIGVRTELAALRQKYGYYMKIETHTIMLKPDQAKKVMDDFLTSALPEIQKCLPDWKKVTAQ